MHQVNIHEAKTNLSKLIEEAVQGEPFIIAKAGKPLVKVTAVTTPDLKQKRRVGFMVGQLTIPKNFDRLGDTEIKNLFDGNL
ncbi:Antitoxin of toxin-antitoxin stability system [Legionella beliardensis]|uniref:Antitoxin n=1 Tax=Legionella beliardensis TaxID=91822 RepID=A0A378JSU3_9GAMM|nr:type II toxin-antitoxin system prevent-host-death family antitoxin [Legionella beliardensis]STX55658.1 Antitoxin of toxin-antitoxin stability system [Legionella beliardensis]